VAGFIKEGINTDHVLRDKSRPSGVALIFVAKDGENSIAVAGGANGELSPTDVGKAKNLFASAGMLVMQLETPLATVRQRRSGGKGQRAGDPQSGTCPDATGQTVKESPSSRRTKPRLNC